MYYRGADSLAAWQEPGAISAFSIVVFLLICFLLICSGGLGQGGESGQEVVLKGKVICVDEAGAEVSCQRENRRFALEVADGGTFEFLSDDPNSKMFEDHRIRQRILQVRGWLRSPNNLEIIKVHSLKDDQLFDIHYFCQTCNIKAFVGGLCWCCQEEFEFREQPVDSDR